MRKHVRKCVFPLPIFYITKSLVSSLYAKQKVTKYVQSQTRFMINVTGIT